MAGAASQIGMPSCTKCDLPSAANATKFFRLPLTRRLSADIRKAEPYRTVPGAAHVDRHSDLGIHAPPECGSGRGAASARGGGDKAVTTAGLARAANCSKESLYKWFGDRDGLLSAMISYQASKVRTFERPVSV